MLVLSRKAEQSLIVDDRIVITVLAIEGDRVKLGIQAPRSITVLRKELHDQLQAANTAAATTQPQQAQAVAAALLGRSPGAHPRKEATTP